MYIARPEEDGRVLLMMELKFESVNLNPPLVQFTTVLFDAALNSKLPVLSEITLSFESHR